VILKYKSPSRGFCILQLAALPLMNEQENIFLSPKFCSIKSFPLCHIGCNALWISIAEVFKDEHPHRQKNIRQVRQWHL
jgi:hypothetical protein